jgi:hypothetical protein
MKLTDRDLDNRYQEIKQQKDIHAIRDWRLA